MGFEVVRNIGSSADLQARAKREAVTQLPAMVLIQLCIKMFWHSLYAAVPQMDSQDAKGFATIVGLILFFADLAIQVLLTDALSLVSESHYHTRSQAVCGAALMVAYSFYFLSSATTVLEISKIGTWVNFVFNVGWLVEMRWGFSQKVADVVRGGQEGLARQ